MCRISRGNLFFILIWFDLFLMKDLEEKQKKYGAQSAKTREEMSRMMKDQVIFIFIFWEPSQTQSTYITIPLLAPLEVRRGFPWIFQCTLHCKDKIPKFRNKYSQKRNIGVSVPISTFMRLWAIYIFPRSVSLCRRKYVEPILGLYKSLTDTWMLKLGLSRAIPRKEYIKGISLQCTYCSTVTAPSQLPLNFPMHSTLQRQFGENSKQIFP